MNTYALVITLTAKNETNDQAIYNCVQTYAGLDYLSLVNIEDVYANAVKDAVGLGKLKASTQPA